MNIREFRGVKIYEGDGNGQVAPSAALANNTLMFSTNVELLESFLREPEESLAGSADFARVAEHLPAQVSTLAFQRQDEVMETIYEMVKQGMAQDDEFDASIMPDYSALRKYFGLTGSYSVPDANGVYMKGFSLKLQP
ncbi:MAG: hypothetical protein R3B90_02620 [Planctomycetaceae bacterium]